ncbi:MAG: S8 family serine peptidase, partial [Candidatus Ratteibacteria bacterium]
MRKLILFLILFTFLFAFSEDRWEKKKLEMEYVNDEIIVKFRSSDAVDSICQKYNLEIKSSFTIVQNLYVLKIKDGMSVEDKIKYLKKENVEYAEPNYIMKFFATPNDLSFNQQWGLKKIKAEQAWDITTGDTSIIVSILDTGIDYTPAPMTGSIDRIHPDLKDNLWINKGELLFGLVNYNRIDNDKDGYVDDFYGINPTIGTFDYLRGAPSEFIEPTPRGPFLGHGTRVAGIIGAVGNNGIGVSGVNWRVSLMPIKIGTSSGLITVDWVLEGIQYIIQMKDRGENIVAVNASFGFYGRIEALEDAIKKLMEKGILFIAAAGGLPEPVYDVILNIDYHPVYPAGIYLPNVISVLATDIDDKPATFTQLGNGTNYGKYKVHVGAPGKDIYSTFPTDSYGYYSGTSMAAAFVTGLSALIKSKFKNYDWIKIKNLILSSGDDITYDTPIIHIGKQINSLKDISITGKRINAYDSVLPQRKNVFSRLRPIGDKVSCYYKEYLEISALNISGEDGAGNVNLNVDGETFTLYDDGTGFDIMRDDGIYSGRYLYNNIGKKTFTLPYGDSFECYFLKGYNYYQTDFTWEDITNSETNLSLIDEEVVKITSPFPIKFGDYSPGFTDIYIDSNGIISFFEDVKYYYWTNNSFFGIPDQSLNVQIAPFRDDLLPTFGNNNVYYGVIGESPNRKLVIEWRNVVHKNVGGTNGITFQVVFFEDKSDILFNYKDVEFGNPNYNYGNNAVVGIQVSNKAGRLYSYRSPFLTNEMSLYWFTGDLPTQLQTPTGLTATGGERSVYLRWDPLSFSTHTGFEIERKHPTIANPNPDYSLIKTVAADDIIYVDSPLYPDSRPYYYRIRAVNRQTGQKSSYSNEVYAVPTAFPFNENPSNLQAFGGWNSIVVR